MELEVEWRGGKERGGEEESERGVRVRVLDGRECGMWGRGRGCACCSRYQP